MKKSHLYIVFLVAASQGLIMGCGKSAASGNNNSSSETSTELPPTKQNKSDIPPKFFGIPYPKGKTSDKKLKGFLKPLNEACIAATGGPLNYQLECVCPVIEGESPKVFSVSEGKCVVLGDGFKIPGKRQFKECKEEGFAKILSEEGFGSFNSCLSKPAKSVGGTLPGKDEAYGYSSFYFNLGNPRVAKDAAQLASMLDESFDVGSKTLSFLNMPAPTTMFTTFDIYVGTVDPSAPEVFGETNVLDGVLFDNINRKLGGFQGRQTKVLYEPELSALRYLMAPEGVFPPPELYPDYEGDSRVLSTLSQARHVFEKREFKPSEISPLTGEDCTKVCRVFGSPFFIGDKDLTYQVIQEKTYSGGVLIMDNIWVYDEALIPKGALVLGLNGQPMVYVKMSFAKEGNALRATYDLFDRKYDAITSQTIEIERDLAELEQGISGLGTIDQVGAGQGVLLCEQLRPDGQDWLFRGPYGFSAQDAKGSVYGWYENADGSPFRMFAGIHPYSFESDGSDYLRSNSFHGLAVAEVIRSSFSGAKIAPMGYCFFKNQSLPGLVNNSSFTGPYSEQRVKVMNSSFAIYGQSVESCKQRAQTSLGKTKGKILAVSSAGNGGLDHPSACPQGLATNTTIVVAGADNAGSENPVIWSESDRGKNYADIATDYHSLDGKLQGTSFAAPRVSGVAAKIAYTYDHLLPQDIRLAILTTAHIPAKKLPVRTGGVLRGESAMAMASCLHIDAEVGRQQGKTAPITKEQARRCLATVDGFGGGKADAQIDFLSSRPLIFE